MGYGYESDKTEFTGYINKHKILELFDEADIFSLVFGYKVEENKYVCSPFRKDLEPNCWFSISPQGRLRFIDFANVSRKNGVKMSHLDCFDAVRLFHNIPNFYQTLEFILESLKDKKKSQVPLIRKVRSISHSPVELYFESRNFVRADAEFWSPYGISKENLIQDNVFPVSRIMMKNTKNGDVDQRLRETCYALTGFEERVKFYYPYRKGRSRFITNCTENDIGSLDKLPPYGSQLIITKSYKDRTVLTNLGKNAVWNQNEGMQPNDSQLFSLVKRFDKVVVWYDNDRQGIFSSQKLSEKINDYFPNKSRPIWLPESYTQQGIKDIADIRSKSLSELNQFIKTMLL